MQKFHRRLGLRLVCCAALWPVVARSAGSAPGAVAMELAFHGAQYLHRWSKAGQNEFTPRGQEDLSAWQDMLTINVHPAATSGEALAQVANQVLGNYQRAGKVVRTASKSRTAEHAAEHLIVAVLGKPQFLEAAFARCTLHEGVGMVVVYSHRIYGKAVGPAMGQWLSTQGDALEKALMAWGGLPAQARLQALPQSP